MGILPLRKKKEAPRPAENDELPPFLAAKAVYRDRLRMTKAALVFVTALALGLIALQEARFHGALAKYTNREILIVPGAVDFMRVRPNVIPDNVVYYFAEYVAERVGTFNHGTVEERAKQLEQFCTPQFHARYMAELRKALPRWRELGATEVFAPVPVAKFVLERDEKGVPHYLVDVHGQLDQYSSDNKLASSAAVISIKFRTSRVVADKPWFFEVEDVQRMSLEDWTRDRQARERLGKR